MLGWSSRLSALAVLGLLMLTFEAESFNFASLGFRARGRSLELARTRAPGAERLSSLASTSLGAQMGAEELSVALWKSGGLSAGAEWLSGHGAARLGRRGCSSRLSMSSKRESEGESGGEGLLNATRGFGVDTDSSEPTFKPRSKVVRTQSKLRARSSVDKIDANFGQSVINATSSISSFLKSIRTMGTRTKIKGVVDSVVIGKVIIDEFVLRRESSVAKIMRLSLGGGSPQAATAMRLWGSDVGMVAPVGQNFYDEMLEPLDLSGVDTRGIIRLPGYVTPRIQIRYESDRMVWTPAEGWDKWDKLNREQLTIPREYAKSRFLHVITEAGGGAEADLVNEFRKNNTNCKVFVSLEPVIHDVHEGVLEALKTQTMYADMVCPDWETAQAISRLRGTRILELRGSRSHPSLMGRYKVQSRMSCGRPVYKREASNTYLYHVADASGCSRWYVGPMVGSTVACIFVDSDALTPEISEGSWNEFNSTTRVWDVIPNLCVRRKVRDVSIVDQDGKKRKFCVGNGHVIMRQKRRPPTIIRRLQYDADNGLVTDSRKLSFFLPSNQSRVFAEMLHALCTASGAEWQELDASKTNWEEIDRTLINSVGQQQLWKAVVDDETGAVYYWNTVTDETTWERPAELLRTSLSQETKRTSIRNVKGDLTSLPNGGKDNQTSITSLESGVAGTDNLFEFPPYVLSRTAKRLGMKTGVLAVRRGSLGSYVLDVKNPEVVWAVPSVKVPVVDPTGAGNAYSAALGLALHQLMHKGGNRTEAILEGACRATATGAAFVTVEGQPLPTDKLQRWLCEEAAQLRSQIFAIPVPHEWRLKSRGRAKDVRPDPRGTPLHQNYPYMQ